ncbi:MAG: hypothetical protein BWX84_01803 [Verrucomicrobia bacterium ADurb.Bin118]|jgi:hypothetical protein|nr:MAG: hypothetical protein BWX84_01803 [Verrucomicrobia bacterium ADurb.Bin118]
MPFIKDGMVRFDVNIHPRRFTPYFACETIPLHPNLESAVLLALLPAMRQNRRLELDQPVSDSFIKNLDALSKIFSSWYREYHPARIHSPNTYAATTAGVGRVGCFFTGGVDSFYTFLKHQREITDLIYVHGFDVDLDDWPRRQAISAMGQSIATQTGIRFIEVETDSRKLFRAFGHWGFHGHGFALGTVGRLLVGVLDKIYIPSSFAQADLMPWGSHPATDPLFSDEALQFVHDGCEATRVRKIQAISSHPVARAHLRVCWERVEGAYNCGRCEKCLRTMTSLYAVGALSAVTTFSAPIDPERIRALVLRRESSRKFARENIELMNENGLQSTPVYQAWKHALNRSDFVNWVLERTRKTGRKLRRSWQKRIGKNPGKA